MPKEEALKIASEKELDLILISTSADLPIARIANFDKFRYEQSKEEKKKNINSSKQQLKHIQFSARSADNDMRTQIAKLEKFLKNGSKVAITLRLRGREKGNKDWARSRMEIFLSMIEQEYKIVSPLKFAGYGMTIHISPK